MNLWTAASDGNIGRVQELLDSGAHGVNDADDSGYTCMHAAASYAHRGLLEFLISRRADVNVRDGDGESPLHACEDVDTAKVLVAAGADINARNAQGMTPEDLAREDERVILADFLQSLRPSGDEPLEQAGKRRRG